MFPFGPNHQFGTFVLQVLRAEKLGKGGKGKPLSWSAIVHVVLVQAQGLTAMDAGDSSDPYCKITLGTLMCSCSGE